MVTLLVARLDGPGADGDEIAWSARGGDPGPVKISEGEWDDLAFLLQSGAPMVSCLRCGARCVLFARREADGRFELPPPVDDFVCDQVACRGIQ